MQGSPASLLSPPVGDPPGRGLTTGKKAPLAISWPHLTGHGGHPAPTACLSAPHAPSNLSLDPKVSAKGSAHEHTGWGCCGGGGYPTNVSGDVCVIHEELCAGSARPASQLHPLVRCSFLRSKPL